MSEDLVLLEVEEYIGTVTINRPKQMNALNTDLLYRLREVLLECGRREDVKVIIITGAGEKSFVAGADIAEMKEMTPRDGMLFAETGQSVFSLIEQIPKPVLAAVNGYALGGGTELAIACDITLASEKARFGTPEVNLGVFPAFGGTQRLTRLLGKARAKEIIFSGEMFDATRALAIGLINRVCPPEELMEETRNLARTIMSKGPVALELAKKSIESGFDLDLSKALLIERSLFAQCFDTEDQKEGMAAFIAKRDPNFKGK
ncbi:MAG: enoyl-CoA hydratase-related protein [bacterium]